MAAKWQGGRTWRNVGWQPKGEKKTRSLEWHNRTLAKRLWL